MLEQSVGTDGHADHLPISFSTEATAGSVGMEGETAHYLGTALHAELLPLPYLSLGVSVPYVFASLPDDNTTVQGLSDVTLEAAAALWKRHDGGLELWAGSQLELPTGDETKHLGGGHVAALPYASLQGRYGPYFAHLRSGLRIGINAEAHHEEPGLAAKTVAKIDGTEHEHAEEFHGSITDPHADTEWVYRAGLERSLNRFWSVGLSANGQTVIGSDASGETFISCMPETLQHWSHNLVTQLNAELPLLSKERFDWRIGLGVSWLL